MPILVVLLIMCLVTKLYSVSQKMNLNSEQLVEGVPANQHSKNFTLSDCRFVKGRFIASCSRSVAEAWRWFGLLYGA